MAVTIEKRPIGVVLGTAVNATINSDYSSAFATVNSTSHGLSSGQYVYIKSNVENYNGFWKISVTNLNEFLLVDNPYVAWIVDATITYQPQVTTHGWSCVHLPIVYELSNTRYPINRIDTARTISSITNDLGYANLNLSGSLGTFEELSFVEISNAPNSDLNGVYQVIDKISTSDVTINLAYTSATNSALAGGTIQLYYSNYSILVKIYAGLNSTHTWEDQKPYELAATIQLIPDDDNTAKFSVNEILKSYVKTKNNLLLATLPNNIDAYCQFYIEVAEQYDTSTGYTVSTLTSGYASDQSVFEGYAVNAMLPFKNVHSGYLSEYLMINSTSKFLTLFAIPVIFACSEDTPECYNEVSLIKTESDSTIVTMNYYSNDILSDSGSLSLPDDPGLYRVPLSASCSYDRLDVVFNANVILNQFIKNPEFRGLDPWYISNTSANFTATYSNNSIVFAFLTGGVSGTNDRLRQSFYPVLNQNYAFSYIINITNYASGNVRLNMRFLDAAGTPITTSSNVDYTSDGLKTGVINLLESVQANIDQITQVEFSVAITSSSSGTGPIATLTLLRDGDVTAISSTKTYRIDCGCANQEIRISWLNYLGAFESPWAFTGQTEHAVDVTASGETTENTFPSWPSSYGEFSDTINKQTFRDSNNRKFVFSQFLTEDEAEALSYIRTSPLVQVVNSRTDRRTIIVDTDSFTKYKDGDKTYTVQFNFRYTDDIPSQSA